MGVHVSSDPCHWPMRALVTSACSPIGPHYQTKPHNVLSGCNDERVQASTDAQSPSVTLLLLQAIGGCSHITSAKIRGSWTPPPPSVSNGQHLAYPPSPPRQQWSAFGLPPSPPSSAFVSICPTPRLYYNFLRRLLYMIKWRILIC